ncbi:DNA repair protein complementing XP-C cells isoform X2 [Dunckerocampus dactyliophorus]|uniref:DNA repair protein complementing XP-C cells isoform X2 n=1 Tax=Dunckerocampus dactyliophorus TaxID=161453 RepID=UPI0024060FE2|nr:DNA repair protein complementing XP-C cells isoform X2 [Dunckerocampus dactyliophorus]
MAKRRVCQEADVATKKLKQVMKAKTREEKRKDADDDNTEVEETLRRKVKPKPRSSKDQAAGNVRSRKSTSVITSKHFHSSPVKMDDTHSDKKMSLAASSATKKDQKVEEDEEESEEEEDDWEEVEELAEPLGPTESPEPVLPSEPVQIEIETPEVRKKQKKKAEFEMYLRRLMNRYKKDLLIDTHKVHLMCLLASAMFHNRLCSEPDLLAITLSLLPTRISAVSKERIDQNYLSGLLKWFRANFTLNPSLSYEEHPNPRSLLERRLASLSAKNHQEMTHLFMLVLRSLRLFCRLVVSLQPIPLKPPSAKTKGATATSECPAKTLQSQGTSQSNSPEEKISLGTKREGGKSAGNRGGKKAKRKELKEEEEEEDKIRVSGGGQRPKNSKRRSIASKVSYKEESNSENEEELSDEEFKASSEEDSEDSESGKKAKQRSTNKSNTIQKRSCGKKEEVKDEGEKGSEKVTKTKQRSTKKNVGPGADEWMEVFLDKTSSWVCIDVEHGVGAPHLCSQNATQPITYVVSVDGDGFVKDLGRKYDPTWMTTTRKRRVEEEWWEETLQPFLRPEDERDKKEDTEMQRKLLNKPLPISITEYKNHPLYALKRHLLKYEAIYPHTAAVLGYCRGEPVYSRDCVHTLHSRDTWLKEARTVRIGEVPYKMVKGFSNRSRKARMMSEQKNENDLALFGEWQTEEYQPPIAVDGKVPRNDYGNVYLFKACMLPVGCVHLRLANLNRVAKKLDLDAAPAVTGFDFHGGYSHAVTDGYIVCEEHEEILRAAWVEEQELQKQREKEKREKRVVSNWTLLVKGLLIRERLKQRYGKKGLSSTKADGDICDGLSSDEDVVVEENPSSKTASETLAMSWPQNRQAEEKKGGGVSALKTKRDMRGKEKHLFPFEKA